MSWSNSASGSAAQVREQIARWAAYQAEADARFAANPAVAATHVTQVAAAVATIERVVDAAPEGAVFSFSAHGSVGQDGLSSGYVNVSHHLSVPTPAAD